MSRVHHSTRKSNYSSNPSRFSLLKYSDLFNYSIYEDDASSDSESSTTSKMRMDRQYEKSPSEPLQYKKEVLSPSCLTSSCTPRLSKNNKNNEIPRIVERLGFIRRTIGIKSESVLYDSAIDEFSGRALCSKVIGKSGVLFVAICDGLCVGCYHNDFIKDFPLNAVFPSKKSFVVILKENVHVTNTVFKRKTNSSKNISLFKNSEMLFMAHGAFTIFQDGEICFDDTDTFSKFSGFEGNLPEDMSERNGKINRFLVVLYE
ncbi:hypothetical protein EIN_274730 [Entamoeba invadens IP1]|uniref:TLDc domain-containing protein n=1 Tax=Entamoeba invadens IP1 TaxID=370355 RepID=A0A0A1U7C9_ENTIV|nr:hypothetical protein EIN_274730 [Entamoeba invadens IP1]ELP87886.1 hypothetical protein EIN_274730 [Entamoeba invadens IP1]|eukprot:XP_004254657.1 hypothetical protein EIN_274730 [Entamoeba invadens IP1]